MSLLDQLNLPSCKEPTIYQYLEELLPGNVHAFNPEAIPLYADATPAPYVVIESDRDQLNAQLLGSKQLRDEFVGVYIYSTADLEYSIKLYYYIEKAKEVVRGHYGVDSFIKLLPASGCLRPMFRDDIKRYYAVIRFRIHYLSI